MSNTIKSTKNTIKVNGVTYGTATYLKNAKKNFNKDKFIRIGDVSYYIPM
jgi:hypothetical protein